MGLIFVLLFFLSQGWAESSAPIKAPNVSAKKTELQGKCDEANKLNKEAMQFIKEKQLHKAIRPFTASIEKCSQNPVAFGNRGGVYFHLQQYELAIKDFESLIKLEPEAMSVIAKNFSAALVKVARKEIDKGDMESLNSALLH